MPNQQTVSTPSTPPIVPPKSNPQPLAAPPQPVEPSRPAEPKSAEPKADESAAVGQPLTPIEERTLIASDGAKLNLVAGVVYHFKLRTGHLTHLKAIKGTIRIAGETAQNTNCVSEIDLAPDKNIGDTFWTALDTYVPCGEAVVMEVYF